MCPDRAAWHPAKRATPARAGQHLFKAATSLGAPPPERWFQVATARQRPFNPSLAPSCNFRGGVIAHLKAARSAYKGGA